MKAKMKAVILISVLLAVSASGYAAYQYQQKREYQEKYAAIDSVKAVVAAKLLDGESARFHNVRKVGKTDVCGEVNAKNAFGAYTGFVEFYGSPGSPQIGIQANVYINSGDSKILYLAAAKGLCY